MSRSAASVPQGKTGKAKPGQLTPKQVESYLARQRTMAQKQHGKHQVRPMDCAAQGKRYIPELEATGRPCLPLMQRPSRQTPAFSGLMDSKVRPAGSHVPLSVGNVAGQPAAITETATLKGRFLTPDGTPVGEPFKVDIHDGSSYQSWTVDAEGYFEATVQAGHDLQLSAAPPPPWLPFRLEDDGVEGTETRQYTLTRGVLLGGHVMLGDQPATGYSLSAYCMGCTLWGPYPAEVDGTGMYSMAVPSGQVVTFYLQGLPERWMFAPQPMGSFTSDQTLDLHAVEGVKLSGRVLGDDGSAVSNADIWVTAQNAGLQYSVDVDGQGRYETLLDPSRAYVFRVSAAGYFELTDAFPPQSKDRTHDFILEAGVEISGEVLDGTDGAAVPGIEVRSLTASGIPVDRAYADDGGNYTILAHTHSKAVLEAGRSDEIWPQPVVVNVGDTPLTTNLVVPVRHDVEFDVLAPSGDAMVGGRLEIWQDGKFLISSDLSRSGEAELSLPAGEYVAKACFGEYGYSADDRDVPYLCGEGLAATSFQVSDTSELTLQIATDDVAVMRVQSTPSNNTSEYPAGRRFELLSVDGDVKAVSYARGEYDRTQGALRLNAPLYVPAGKAWRLRIRTPGAGTWTSAPFEAVDDGIVSVELPGVDGIARWTGVVRNADGAPLPGVEIKFYDQAQTWIIYRNTSGDGSFDLPACAGCVYRFGAPADGSRLGHVERLVHVDGSMQRDVVLDDALEFHSLDVTDRHLQLLYGDPDGDRYDILFLGDGYTANNETFTDTNGNGVWDGVVYYDYNDNGVWDGGEPLQTYGTAAAPEQGTDPTVNNEPFDDVNGDGALNIGEAQIFFQDARDYMRALLAHDYWREHRHAFRAWTYLTYSNQAGTSVVDGGGDYLVQRDSLFQGTMETVRSTLSVNYARAMQVAATVLPSYDTIVMFLNQPIPMGRANSFVLANGGLLASSPNDDTPGHEFGHKVGGLPDEYNEFGGVYAGGTGGPEMTRMLERDLVPWQAWLRHDLSAGEPTTPYAIGVGLFAGGAYESGGIYRATFNSTMRHNSPYFSAYQKYLMSNVNWTSGPDNRAPIRGAWSDPDHTGHGVAIELADRGTDGNQYTMIFYTYDAGGMPEYYMAVGTLKDGKIGPVDLGYPVYDPSTHGATYPEGSVGRLAIDLTAAAASSPACRDHDGDVKAVMHWTVRGESGTWCISPLVGWGGRPVATEDVNGLWSAASSDSGWGLTVVETREAGSKYINPILYYYDAANQPRWAMPGKVHYEQGATIPLYQMQGYCRTCAEIALGHQPIGSMTVGLNYPEHVEQPSGENWISVGIDGDGDISFDRDSTPMRLYSLPAGQ